MTGWIFVYLGIPQHCTLTDTGKGQDMTDPLRRCDQWEAAWLMVCLLCLSLGGFIQLNKHPLSPFYGSDMGWGHEN